VLCIVTVCLWRSLQQHTQIHTEFGVSNLVLNEMYIFSSPCGIESHFTRVHSVVWYISVCYLHHISYFTITEHVSDLYCTKLQSNASLKYYQWVYLCTFRTKRDPQKIILKSLAAPPLFACLNTSSHRSYTHLTLTCCSLRCLIWFTHAHRALYTQDECITNLDYFVCDSDACPPP